METCAVSKLEDWKEFPEEKEPSSNNQELSEKHPHQVFKEEEIMESEYEREIKVELAPVNTEDINPKPKEINLTGIMIPRREKGNTFHQIFHAINSYNLKIPEEIRRKQLTKLLSPIKALKSLSKGIFKNTLKSSIKPVSTVINVTEEERYLNSHPNKLALNSLKEISLKNKITINKDLKHQDHSLVQEESISSTSKHEESEELNKKLEYIIKNQLTNGNDYGHETFRKASRKPNIKDNGEKCKSLIQQEVTSPPIGFSKVLRPKKLLKKDNNETQKLQHLPSNMLNKEIQPENKAIKQVITVEKGSKITKNEVPINPKPQNFTNIRDHIEQYFMERKQQQNYMCSSNPIRHSPNAKAEDSPTPHFHSDKDNPNLNLETNYFSLDKANEIQINKTKEINEQITNRQ
ncbi:hypothetical protein O181_098907 [Austropuccinia psidii MF-1]|uniref:Uncharacterized protein n=1 Tax=Austropuccinia psidii MF-1 TaxID=1389203 RepID=A0A9Q3PG08_9BASI|nr:hypothetical protein [Austropuccinia psidii MF-1]